METAQTGKRRWVSGREQELLEQAAAFVTATAYRALDERGRFSMVLAGGSTPRSLYSLLAKGLEEKTFIRPGHTLPAGVRRSAADPGLVTLPWRHTMLFQGDERYVPPTHPDSNFGMVRESLLRHICIPPQNIVRMPVESGDADADAITYEKLLRGIFRHPGACTAEGFPMFDLVLLGLGDDGHTASLFPGDAKALGEGSRCCIAVEAPGGKPPGTRLTLTLPVINSSANVMFLVPGSRHALARSIHDSLRPDLPAGMVNPGEGSLWWFVGNEEKGPGAPHP
jgi:6-phosphogluconolactonase